MENKDVILSIPNGNVGVLIEQALQLSEKERNQILKGIQDGSYEMATSYLWKKTTESLKKQLSCLGMPFISELLGKTGADELLDYREISDYDSLRLAEELGFLSGPTAFRLKQASDSVGYFSSSEAQDAGASMNVADAATILFACVTGVLSKERIDAALDFRKFRDDIEGRPMSQDEDFIQKFSTMPYFYLRTTVRILTSVIKKDSGAQLENALANGNLIIPLIWGDLHAEERFLIGRCYSDLYSDGNSKALSGVKKILLGVKGFDFVPEDTRSRAFIKAANHIIDVHFSMNNYYFEPAAVKALVEMGSVIPTPALSSCLSAVLCVKLGNMYGVSYAAQPYADSIIKTISKSRWEFYFKDCLPSDSRILAKLMSDNPIKRWIELFNAIDALQEISVDNKDVSILIEATIKHRPEVIRIRAKDLYIRLGGDW